MIGQKKLIESIDRMADNNTLARFLIIYGQGRCGKRTIAKYIAEKLNAQTVKVDIKIDSVREAIKTAYQTSEPTVYLIADADRMSTGAKNTLLKVTEEPPRQAYFIVTLQDIENTLDTLKSRADVIKMMPYSQAELADYLDSFNNEQISETEKEIVISCSTVPSDIDIFLAQESIIEMYNYAEKVVTSIGKVTGANALKVGSKLAYKEEDKGYAHNLFMRVVTHILFSYLSNETENFSEFSNEVFYKKIGCSIHVTSRYNQELAINGINKAATIDMWILALRKIWTQQEVK